MTEATRGMKYIRYNSPIVGDMIILFPRFWNHWSFLIEMKIPESYVVSAGFVKQDNDGRLVAYGDSFSLQVKSREEDTDMIHKQLEQV